MNELKIQDTIAEQNNNFCFDKCKNFKIHCEDCYSTRMYMNFKCKDFVYKNAKKGNGNGVDIPISQKLMDSAKNNLCIMCDHFVNWHTCPIDYKPFLVELCKIQKLKFHNKLKNLLNEGNLLNENVNVLEE